MDQITSPLFSIVTPVYNCKDFILETIRSVEQQTYRNFELVIVDDHSTDSSFEKATRYLSKSSFTYQLVKRPEHLPKGVAACRNYGIEIARGEWICFLDSDDKFLPNKLEILSRTLNSGVSRAFHHSVEYIDVSGNKLSDRKNASGKTELAELIEGNTIVTSSVCVTKNLLVRAGYFNWNLHGVEDYLMWLKISFYTKWNYLEIPLTQYRVRDNSLMGERRLQHYVTENVKLYKAAKNEIEFSPDQLKAFHHNLFYRTMRYYVSISLNKYGYGDFVRGVLILMSSGQFGSAAYFLNLIHWRLVLRFLSAIKTKLLHIFAVIS